MDSLFGATNINSIVAQQAASTAATRSIAAIVTKLAIIGLGLTSEVKCLPGTGRTSWR
jgi:hypothetical protein